MNNKQLMIEADSLVAKTSIGSIGISKSISLKLFAGEIGVFFDSNEFIGISQLILEEGEIVSGYLRLPKFCLDQKNSYPEQFSWKQSIGYGFRKRGLIGNLTLLENVDLPARYHNYYKIDTPDGSLASKAMEEIGVPKKFWHLRPYLVPDRIWKMALLARSVVLNPQILLLDAPTQLFTSTDLPNLLRWINVQKMKGMAILINLLNFDFALDLADWVYDAKNGQQRFGFVTKKEIS